MAPSYLTEMFKEVSDVHSYNTRLAKSGLCTNRGAGKYYTKTFKYSGIKLWNVLPAHLHKCRTLENFRKQCALFFMDKIKYDEFISCGWTV